MGAYRALFSITVEHAYFSKHWCRMLEFVSTDSCAKLLKKAGLLLKSSESGVAVYFDEEKIDILRLHAIDPLKLSFKVFSTDRNFFRYTSPGAAPSDEILFFNNQQVMLAADGKQLLHRESVATSFDQAKITANECTEILDQKDMLIKPIFIVQMTITADATGLCTTNLATDQRKFFIRFSANTTFWNYYLLGELTTRNVYIADLDSEIQFQTLGSMMLSDQREAILLQSSQAIPLQEHPACRLQLREIGQMGDKVLIKRLPNANINQTFNEIINGQMQTVSEIYIS